MDEKALALTLFFRRIALKRGQFCLFLSKHLKQNSTHATALTCVNSE